MPTPAPGPMESLSTEVTVANVAGHRVRTTTTWLKRQWPDGRNDRTEQTSDDQDEGLIIDPTRVTSQATAGQTGSAGTVGYASATDVVDGGQCGLTGTMQSCARAVATVPSGCAGIGGTTRACAPARPLPGPAGATGTTTPVGSTSANPHAQGTPQVASRTGAGPTPATSGADRGGGGSGPTRTATGACEPDDSSNAANTGARTFGSLGESDLRAAAQVADRNGLTQVGRALQKHSGREGSVFNGFSSGTATARNEQGLQVLDEILCDPGGRMEVLNRVTNIWDSTGRGVRFGNDGSFMGFLEPLG